MDTRNQLQTSTNSTHEVINKLQMDYEDLQVNYQRAANSEK